MLNKRLYTIIDLLFSWLIIVSFIINKRKRKRRKKIQKYLQ